MPSVTFSQSIAAGATFLPLDGSQFNYLPYPALVELLHRATAVGIVCTFTSGTDTLMEEGPVAAGGTAGVIPSRQNVEPLTDPAPAGALMKIKYRNTTGGAVTVDGVVNFTPLRGARR